MVKLKFPEEAHPIWLPPSWAPLWPAAASILPLLIPVRVRFSLFFYSQVDTTQTVFTLYSYIHYIQKHNMQ